MKRLIRIALIILAATGIYLVLRSAFPVYARFMPGLLFLLLLDGYLWSSVWQKIHDSHPGVKYTISGLYWLPLILIIFCIVAGFIIPFAEWNIPVRTMVPGMIFIILASKIFPVAFLLLADIFRLFLCGIDNFTRGRDVHLSDHPRNGYILETGWVLGTIFFVLMIMGMALWNYDFRVKKTEIVLPELPAGFDGLKIVQISDTHLGSWSCASKLEKSVDLVNGLNPDLIFFTGDMANYTALDVVPFENVLKRLKAPMGIFAILGNHDYGAYVKWPSQEAKLKDMEEMKAFYRRLGWRLLLNEHSILKKGNDSIVVLGVENWGKESRFQKLADLPAALNGVENMQVQLLLSHDPSFWDSVICRQYRNIDITFSGHTHGMQFGIECCGIRWSPAEYLYEQWGGLYEKPVSGSHPQYIYVNLGLGSLGYPGRVGILPEITLFTLRK